MFWLLFAPFRWLRRLIVLGVLVVVVLAALGVVAYQHSAGSGVGTYLKLPGVRPGDLFGGDSTPTVTRPDAGERPAGYRADGVLLPAGPDAHHNGVAEPDRSLTPGATDPRVTQAGISATICRAGYTTTVRPPLAYTGGVKRRLMAQAGVPGTAGQWELDHLVPLELGGDPGYTLNSAGLPVNLWLEPRTEPDGAHSKDNVESVLHHAVCDRQVTLRAAQVAIGTDWYTALNRLHLSTDQGR